MSKKVKRLYSQFAPEHYEISLEISQDKQTFQGTVQITGTRKSRPSQRLTLHQKGLKVFNPKLIHVDKKGVKKQLDITRTVLHAASDEVRFHTEDTLYPGKYEIVASFSGIITRNMEGIYPCFYEDEGQQKQLIASQFESHFAREAFPCIDEPEAKATFQLTLTHNSDEIALSNTEPDSTTKSTSNERTTTTFAITPVMSTYLLAFVVGDMAYKETRSKSGVTIRTYATKNQVEHTAFALTEAAVFLDFYEQYFDIPFPLKKCDFVALPDFASGAMENWGLITFREQALLVDEHTSLSSKQYVSIVVAHELTHQWFGNLVTMRWWTDLWLNEGFASWMEYLAVDTFHPEWEMWTQFSVDEQQLALKMDSLEFTHPIEVPVGHPDEIRTIFDAISYQKGASIIHMLHDYLGADAFRDGLRHYLKQHAYKNTDTVDLWQALEDISKKPVKAFMHAWTSQKGFPLLSVDLQNDHLHIEQNVFIVNPHSQSRKDETCWPVPLLAEGLNSTVVEKRSTNIPIKPDNAPIKLNTSQTGFYRVDYSKQLQERQVKALQAGSLSSIDRMGLLSDGIEVTRSGHQSVVEYLELLQHYRNETTLPVWDIIATSIGAIRTVLSKSDTDNELRDLIKPFIRELVAPQLERLGFGEKISEPHLDTLLRPLIIGLAAGADEEAVVTQLKDLYHQRITLKASIDPNIRGVMYSTVARLGGMKEYKELLGLYTETHSSDEKLSLTAALTSFEQPEIHLLILELLKTDTVRLQDISYWIAYSFMNRYSRKATWEWMRDNWQWLRDSIGNDLSFARMPVYAARNFSDTEFLREYTVFFDSIMEPMLKRSYAQGVEMIETNSAWRTRDWENALKWFTSQAQ